MSRTGNLILNLTQHVITPEQLAAGVYDLEDGARQALHRLLTFEAPPPADEIAARAASIAALAAGAPAAMLGGAPFLLAALERALRARGVRPLYAFTRRQTETAAQPDGSVRKLAVFRHTGFVEPPVMP